MTEHLFDAALAELAVVARGSPCLLAGDFNVEPTKIPCLSKGISAGLWVDLDAAWSDAEGQPPAVTGKRGWVSTGGNRRDFLVGCPPAAAALLSCSVSAGRWLQPHFAVSATFDCDRWSCRVTQSVRCTPLWLASWLPALDKSRGSESVEVQRVCEVYDGRLRFMSLSADTRLTRSLLDGDVSSAWAVWSSAAESVCQGVRFLVGVLFLFVVLLDFVLYALLVLKFVVMLLTLLTVGTFICIVILLLHLFLDLWRRLKVVSDILGDMLKNGFILARSFEFTAQWNSILSAGPLHLVTMDLLLVQEGGLGWIHEVVGDLRGRLSDFIHRVVVHRRDDAIRGWRGWLREDPLVRPQRWLRPDLVPPPPFSRCDPHLTPGGSGWLPYFCRSGQREASLEEFNEEVVGWLLLLSEIEIEMPPLIGDDLFQVVRRKTATAGSLDGWGWRELKSLLVPWFDCLARILAEVEELGVWPEGLLDAYIAMIPKVGGDSTLHGQRPLSVPSCSPSYLGFFPYAAT